MPTVSYRTAALVALLVAILYAAFWLWRIPMFTPFPSDELSLIQELDSRRGLFIDDQNLIYYLIERAIGQERNGLLDFVGVYNLFKVINDYRSPVYLAFLYLGENLCHALTFSESTCGSENIIVDVIIFSNALIVFLLGTVIFRITRSFVALLTVQVFYVFSAWPVTYLFFNSYTVFTAAITFVVVFVLIEALDRIQENPVSGKMLLVVGGAFCSFVLYSSPAAPLIVSLLLAGLCAMSWEGKTVSDVFNYTAYRFQFIVPFIITFVVGTLLFSFLGLDKLRAHVLGNVNTEHYDDALLAHDSVPSSPFLTYFRILRVYGGLWLTISVAIALIAIPFLLRGRVYWTERTSVAKKAMLGLLLIIGGHVLAIDLLPFTKLARHQFVVYPLTALIIGIVGHALWTLASRQAKRLVVPVILLALTGTAYAGWQQVRETIQVRSELVERVAGLRSTNRIYVLCEDPHRLALMTTLNWKTNDKEKVRAITYDEFYRLVERNRHAGNIVLMLGPHSRGSGMSAARHSSLPDFDVSALPGFTYLREMASTESQTEYYMYYPPFLLEEEISQAFLFAGMSPDPKSDVSKQVTLFAF